MVSARKRNDLRCQGTMHRACKENARNGMPR
jgi:hypothetical protein